MKYPCQPGFLTMLDFFPAQITKHGVGFVLVAALCAELGRLFFLSRLAAA